MTKVENNGTPTPQTNVSGLQELLISLDRSEIANIVGSPNAPADPMAISDQIITYVLLKARAGLWQNIATAPQNTKVLAAYQNELGNWRIVTACYHTRLDWSDEYGDHEAEFAPEAWYEENDSSEVIYPTSRVPTHWMPLPAYPVTEEASDV